ncbi:MAG: hypothetical protein AAGB15_11245, partial [Pseudomonadota bacterium]
LHLRAQSVVHPPRRAGAYLSAVVAPSRILDAGTRTEAIGRSHDPHGIDQRWIGDFMKEMTAQGAMQAIVATMIFAAGPGDG